MEWAHENIVLEDGGVRAEWCGWEQAKGRMSKWRKWCGWVRGLRAGRRSYEARRQDGTSTGTINDDHKFRPKNISKRMWNGQACRITQRTSSSPVNAAYFKDFALFTRPARCRADDIAFYSSLVTRGRSYGTLHALRYSTVRTTLLARTYRAKQSPLHSAKWIDDAHCSPSHRHTCRANKSQTKRTR